MEGRLEEIGRSIDIRVGMPATGTSIRSTGSAIRLGDLMASMAGLRRKSLINLDGLDALPFRLIRDHVRQLGKGPGVQALIEVISVIDLLADSRQLANGNRIDPRLAAPIYKVLGDDV